MGELQINSVWNRALDNREDKVDLRGTQSNLSLDASTFDQNPAVGYFPRGLWIDAEPFDTIRRQDTIISPLVGLRWVAITIVGRVPIRDRAEQLFVRARQVFPESYLS